MSETIIAEEQPGSDSIIKMDVGKVYPFIGVFMIATALGILIRRFWMRSVVLYCYDGGEEYKKIALLFLKEEKEQFELFVPLHLLERKGTPRYRLAVKGSLVKRCNRMDIVVKSQEGRVRRPMEECVDFVL